MHLTDGHIVIRNIRSTDKQRYCEILSDARVSGTLRGKINPDGEMKLLSDCTADELQQKFELAVKRSVDGKPSIYVVDLYKTMELIGSIGSYEIDSDRIGLTYWLAASFQGKGIGPKMLKLYCDPALQHFQKRWIIANIARDNPASASAVRKAGFVSSPEREDAGFDLIDGRELLEYSSCTVQRSENNNKQ